MSDVTSCRVTCFLCITLFQWKRAKGAQPKTYTAGQRERAIDVKEAQHVRVLAVSPR